MAVRQPPGQVAGQGFQGALHSSDRQDWRTPRALYSAIADRLGGPFDLDAAALAPAALAPAMNRE